MKKYLLMIIAVVLFTSCEKKVEEVEKVESLKSVFVTKAKLKDKSQNRVFNATAFSNNQTKLSFKVQGNINHLKIQLGDEIKKGDLLAKLDSKPYELKVSQIKYALSEALAGLQNAKSTYERTKKLYVNQNASVSDIDNSRASYNAASAKVKNITKELEYAKLQLSYTKLYAPSSGYISLKYVHENENVAVGTPVVLISDKLVNEVKVQVPEIVINKIKKNDTVKVVFSSLDKNRSFTAKVSEISKYASESTKTYQVLVKLINSSNLIKSGMSADVYFNLNHKQTKEIFCIPSNSVLNDNNGYFVYVIEKAGNKYFIKRKNIEVGSLTKDGYEVFEGINFEDLILKAGMSEVYVNMEVEIGNLKDLGN